ncbi:GNAT family N-acetyltransferase [Roseateles amylovorans]|uniref:GNAT family N-acetyltransferase n=1 Tax=Roseateles amylovorans TaxID=2978473 RepID=A0ABY6AYP5_9BURK|nr:GNAT family N-acetyltransferase [Roseateles amylovorans]UXH78301.1 GNAT family N-acetyltransferase [Roseateles amylovorans]
MSLALTAPEKQEHQPLAQLRLRHATLADAQAIAAIYNASLRTPPYQADGTTEADGARWLAEQMAQVRQLDAPPIAHYLGPMSLPMAANLIAVHLRAKRHMLVAELDGDVVGWMGSLGLHERPGLSTLFEIAYYVAPRVRGRGIGTRLVDHLIQNASEWGVDRLLAMVWSDNAASLSVLRRAGFDAWGALPGAITAFGKRRDMLLLGRVLPNVTG